MSTDATPPITLRLTGELTVRTIAEAHQKLISELGNCDALLIDASEITDADLSLVQLIESARHSAAREGKSVAVATPVADCLHQVLKRGGFLHASDSASFWKR